MTKEHQTARVSTGGKFPQKQFASSSVPPPTQPTTPRPLRPSALLNQIKTQNPSEPLAPFQQLAQEIAEEYHKDESFSKSAVIALQEAAEAYLIGLFQDTNLGDPKRITISSEDIANSSRVVAVPRQTVHRPLPKLRLKRKKLKLRLNSAVFSHGFRRPIYQVSTSHFLFFISLPTSRVHRC